MKDFKCWQSGGYQSQTMSSVCHRTTTLITSQQPTEYQTNQCSIVERKASLKYSLLMDVYGVKVDGFWGAIVLYI